MNAYIYIISEGPTILSY